MMLGAQDCDRRVLIVDAHTSPAMSTITNGTALPSNDSPTQLLDMPNSSASWRLQALGNEALGSAEEGCQGGTSSSALSRGWRARATRNCSARATMSCACPISACAPGMSPPQDPGPAPEQLPRAAAVAGVEQAPPPGLGLLHRCQVPGKTVFVESLPSKRSTLSVCGDNFTVEAAALTWALHALTGAAAQCKNHGALGLSCISSFFHIVVLCHQNAAFYETITIEQHVMRCTRRPRRAVLMQSLMFRLTIPGSILESTLQTWHPQNGKLWCGNHLQVVEGGVHHSIGGGGPLLLSLQQRRHTRCRHHPPLPLHTDDQRSSAQVGAPTADKSVDCYMGQP